MEENNHPTHKKSTFWAPKSAHRGYFFPTEIPRRGYFFVHVKPCPHNAGRKFYMCMMHVLGPSGRISGNLKEKVCIKKKSLIATYVRRVCCTFGPTGLTYRVRFLRNLTLGILRIPRKRVHHLPWRVWSSEGRKARTWGALAPNIYTGVFYVQAKNSFPFSLGTFFFLLFLISRPFGLPGQPALSAHKTHAGLRPTRIMGMYYPKKIPPMLHFWVYFILKYNLFVGILLIYRQIKSIILGANPSICIYFPTISL